MELRLRDKVVLVTGASGGIGRAIAEAFAAEGCRVVCHAHRGGNALASWLATRPWADRALAVTADVTAPAEVDGAFDAAVARFGRVDVCIANAGWRPRASERLDAADEERIRRTIDVNLLGTLWTARSFLARLAPRADGDGASLLLVGSTAASFGERGHADYAAAKAGLFGLLLTLRNEIVTRDPRGRVNLVEPGWTVTHVERRELDDLALVGRVVQTMPLRQLARAEDVARAAVWLSSPAASRHVTGQVLRVAGGMEGRVLWQPEDLDPGAIRDDARP